MILFRSQCDSINCAIICCTELKGEKIRNEEIGWDENQKSYRVSYCNIGNIIDRRRKDCKKEIRYD